MLLRNSNLLSQLWSRLKIYGQTVILHALSPKLSISYQYYFLYIIVSKIFSSYNLTVLSSIHPYATDKLVKNYAKVLLFFWMWKQGCHFLQFYTRLRLVSGYERISLQFSVGTLITHIIRVYLISMFQHGSSNPARDSSWKIVFLY